MDEREAAERNLDRIRMLMERAGRYSNLSGWSCIVAGLLAAAGTAASWPPASDYVEAPDRVRRLEFIWGTVFVLAAAQNIAFTILHARRRGEPAWSHLTRQVTLAVLPGIFVGAVVTGYGVQSGQVGPLPAFWMLAYGMSVMGLGLYTGGEIRLVGVLFLLMGAVTLLWLREHAVIMMLPSFGGLHLLLGGLILWKSRR